MPLFFTTGQLFPCIARQLFHCTAKQLFPVTTKRLYSSTTGNPYSVTTGQLSPVIPQIRMEKHVMEKSAQNQPEQSSTNPEIPSVIPQTAQKLSGKNPPEPSPAKTELSSDKKTEQSPDKDKKDYGRDLYEWVQALVSSVIIVVMLFTFAVRMIGVDGHSMVPTLQHGDRLLVLTPLLYNDYQYGDIVIVRKDSFGVNPIVKRVIATAGQTIDIDFTTGSVWVDGELLYEPYIRELTLRDEGTVFPLTVPDGCIFVMGDNRNESTDSRSPRLGVIDTRYVIGRAVFLLFPGTDYYDNSHDFSRLGFLT